MKINRIQKRAAVAAIMACTAFAGVASAAQADNTQEKIRLMVTAVQARDSGDFKASKQALEELVKLAPNDESVQRMLADVNADIERQSKGETPVLTGQVAADKVEAAQKVAKEEAVNAEAEKAEAVKVEDKAEAKAEAPADAVVSEATRKQQLSILAAFDLIDEAYDAMDSGNWDVATEKLTLADEKIASYEYSPASDQVRSELKRARATMAKERANIAMADRDVKNAKKFAGEYAAAEENQAKAQKFTAEVDAFEENPYNNKISDVSPDYSVRLERVNALLEKGRRQYLYGDYAGARSTFRQIETLDANNIQAKAYLRLVAEKLLTPGKLSYLATRESMLDEVNQSWVRPQVYSGASVDMGGTRTDSVVDAKLRNIVIPNVSFPDPGVPLAQAINTLSVLSVDYDKSTEGKKGVNIVLFDTGGETKNVVLTLRDLPLGQILNWVTQQAGYQYDIENDTIVVRKASDTSSATSSMDTLDFPITQAAVTRMIGIKAAGSAGSDNPFDTAAAGGGDDNKGEAIKQFLIKAGVEFGQGANLAFDGTKLWVTNTRRNLDKVRNILLRYSEIKQVEIEAKFMEVSQGDLKELGFNWTVAQFDSKNEILGKTTMFASSNRSLKDSAQSTNAGRTPIQITEAGSAVEPTTLYPSVPSLPSTINIGGNSTDTTSGFIGFLNSYAFDLQVRALEQKNGSDLLCAPKVTVISGSTASITVSQQMRYPESWGDMQSNVGTSSSSSSGSSGSAGVTITPGTPTDFTTYDVGVVMEVTPNVEEDGSINLVLNPRVTEFEGFLEYGGVAVAISSGTTVTVPSGFIQPVFSVREVRTSVTVFDGATLVMGGLTREQVITVDDRVPVLGDIPWVGRLFQSKGETRQKKNLLIFVTVNRISPGGSAGREQFQEMRPGSVFQNPIIVSPGGAVQRVLETENAGAEK